MKYKQYTLQVCRYIDGKIGNIIFCEDYYTKEALKNDLKMFNREYCNIMIFFSKFNGTDEFIELDIDRF